MLITVGIVDDRLVLDGLLRHREVDVDSVAGVGSGEDGELESGESFAGVPVRLFGKVAEGVVVRAHRQVSQAALLVRESAVKEGVQILGGERFELEDLRARDEGGVDVEIGVVGGRSDEAHRSALDVGKEDILLGLVEAVDLVDEENRALIAELGVGARLFDLGANLGHVGFDPVEGLKAGSRAVRDHPREGGLARARWAVEDERGEAVRFDGPAEQFALTQDVLLTGDLVEATRTETRRQRFTVPGRGRLLRFVRRLHEEPIHTGVYVRLGRRRPQLPRGRPLFGAGRGTGRIWNSAPPKMREPLIRCGEPRCMARFRVPRSRKDLRGR